MVFILFNECDTILMK